MYTFTKLVYYFTFVFFERKKKAIDDKTNGGVHEMRLYHQTLEFLWDSEHLNCKHPMYT